MRGGAGSVVMTTHSEEMISQAIEKEAFTLLRLDDAGSTITVRAVDDANAAYTLLSRPPVEGLSDFRCNWPSG
jgi:hypothetical protein